MSRLSNAAAKLDTAIDRIEAALASRSPSAESDRNELQMTIDQVRQENAALKQSVGNAQDRLDHAIDRIRSMVGD